MKHVRVQELANARVVPAATGAGAGATFLTTHNALRGIAALAVLLYHLQLDPVHRLALGVAERVVTRGYIWVDFFFMLSGFVIARSYVERIGTGRLSWRRFLRARAARIVPMHLVALTLLAALVWLLRPSQASLGGAPFWEFTERPDAGHLLLQTLLVHIWHWPAALSWNIPTWSISVEMQVYLAFPALAWLVVRRPTLAPPLLLAAAGTLYLCLAAIRPSLDILDPFALARCAAGFLTGMAITRSLPWTGGWLDRHAAALQVTAVSWLVAALAYAGYDVVAIPALALLVAATAHDRGPLAAMLRGRGWQALGRWSYSIYLLNFPVLLGADAVWPRTDATTDRIIGSIALAVMLVAASAATYRWIEEPARRRLGPGSDR